MALILLLLCGFVFPVLLSGISAVLFPSQANGSLVYSYGQAVGSAHVGQEFTKPYFMKGRPSAYHYNTYYQTNRATGTTVTAPRSPGLVPVPTNYAPLQSCSDPAGRSNTRLFWRQTRRLNGRISLPIW